MPASPPFHGYFVRLAYFFAVIQVWTYRASDMSTTTEYPLIWMTIFRRQVESVGMDYKAMLALIHSDSNKGPNMTSEVKNYSKSTTGLWKQLLAYFDETLNIYIGEKCCSNCSTKLSISETDDIPPPH